MKLVSIIFSAFICALMPLSSHAAQDDPDRYQISKKWVPGNLSNIEPEKYVFTKFMIVPFEYGETKSTIISENAEQRVCYGGIACRDGLITEWTSNAVRVKSGQYIQLRTKASSFSGNEIKVVHKISNTEKEWRVRTREERSCHTPELGTIPSEGKITAYESLSVSPSAKCKSEQRVCDDGVLSGSFKFRECVIAIDDRCYDAPWGKLEKGIDPGRIIVAYQKETVPFGETCAFEKQICQNGKFSGTYTHEKCIIEEPKSCTDDVWGEVKHGETRPVYKYAERQPGDSTCARNQKTVSCENGVMTSVKGYKNKECTDIQAKMCDSPCGQIEHGKTCMAFRDCGDYESRVCNNGKLSGSYELRYPNCQSCLMPWGERVSHGSVRIAYKDDSVASLKECRNRKITCDNGVVNDHGYQFRTCTPDAK